MDDSARAALVKAKAIALGFDAVGIADARPLEADFARYEAFVAAGMHGSMEWLAENRESRRAVDGEGGLPGARSVICVARRYKRHDDQDDPPLAATIARYARGRDYHNHVRKKLRQLAAFVRTLPSSEEPFAARPIVDDAPILERAWASRAGLGFVGKNGLVIAPGLGSYVLLGEVLTTAPLAADTPLAERCGTCTRCLDACPTAAFPRPFVLDPRRCLSYWTIEHRGEIPEEFAVHLREHLFGCDVCQEVCPFNASKVAAAANTEPFAPLPRWSELSVEALADADDEALRGHLEGTPLHRAGPAGIRRNALAALRARR